MLRCRGKSYLDLLAQRAGDCEDAPDAVVAPADHEQALAVLQACADAGVAVVPFGGGTSVVGGPRAAARAVRGAGLARPRAHGPAAGRRPALADRGARRGHPPARGRPRARRPRAHARPRAAELRVGDASAAAWRRARPARRRPAAGGSTRTSSRSAARRRSASWPRWPRPPPPPGRTCASSSPARRARSARSRPRRCACTRCRRRGATRAGWSPASRRAASCCGGSSRPASRPTSRGCRTRTRPATRSRSPASPALAGAARSAGRCLIVCGWEGTADEIRRRRRAVGRIRGLKAIGERWAHSRFAGPHLRDDLLDRGVMVETLETATSWSNLTALRAAVRAALPGMLVGCHVSHLYPTGASLYFTVLARQAARPGGSVARRQGRRHRRDRRRRRHDHAPPRRRPRPRAVAARRGRRARRRRAARAQGPLRPGRDHEPGEASMRSACSGASSGICRPTDRQRAAGERAVVDAVARGRGRAPAAAPGPAARTPTSPAPRSRTAPRRGRAPRRRAGRTPGRGGRRARPRRRAAAPGSACSARSTPPARPAPPSDADAMSHSIPKWPNSAVAARNERSCVRPVVCARGGPTCEPTSSGGSSSCVQRWIDWRSSASLVSLAHTRSVRARIPRSTRAPPDEQLSISTAGWRARSSSSSRYVGERLLVRGRDEVAVVIPLEVRDVVLGQQGVEPFEQVVVGLASRRAPAGAATAARGGPSPGARGRGPSRG